MYSVESSQAEEETDVSKLLTGCVSRNKSFINALIFVYLKDE